MLSIILEKPRVFKMLLKYGADVNKKDQLEQTVLHYASRNWSVGYLCILLHHPSLGAIDCFDMINETPLAKAILTKTFNHVYLLLDAGAKISNVKDTQIPDSITNFVQKRNQLKRRIVLFLALSKPKPFIRIC